MDFCWHPYYTTIKPWPNGTASRRKLKTWVYFQLRLARPCVPLRWLAMACAHFGRDHIWTQADARFSPFGHPTEVNASWVTPINLLLTNEIQDMSALKWVFCDLRVIVRKLACPFGHPTQVTTQVQLAATCDDTCDFLRVLLVRALSPGQTESQVDASRKLGSTRDSVWPGLARTCVDLRWLALTLVEIKFPRKSKQVFHRLAKPNPSQRNLSDVH